MTHPCSTGLRRRGTRKKSPTGHSRGRNLSGEAGNGATPVVVMPPDRVGDPGHRLFQRRVGPARFERRPIIGNRRDIKIMVGRRGDAPLVPPYRFRRLNKAMVLSWCPCRIDGSGDFDHNPAAREATHLSVKTRDRLAVCHRGSSAMPFVSLQSPRMWTTLVVGVLTMQCLPVLS